ncbi:hypothetical protein TNCT_466471 [Trichonephila clavata]|uniref:Pre-C2HC domain-containing protein n=1 Tax=Trichonephila clavata TaxID=2740835 RepID=A0A8X6F7G6_TRICU|nr:hypothetical protein TNCT_466471 [Trichonephila clavata]
MPVDMPIPDIVEDLHNLSIIVNECKIMTNRKTGLPMPLFLLILPKTEDNKNIFNISELCFMKIKPEVLKKNMALHSVFAARVSSIVPSFQQETHNV